MMNTRADKAAETKSTSIANGSPTWQSNGRASSQFLDKRPEPAALMKMQGLANNSPRGSQLRALQELATNSHQAKQATQFQALADPTAPLLIRHKIANGIAQRAQEATEDDELIQAKTQTAQRQAQKAANHSPHSRRIAALQRAADLTVQRFPSLTELAARLYLKQRPQGRTWVQHYLLNSAVTNALEAAGFGLQRMEEMDQDEANGGYYRDPWNYTPPDAVFEMEL